MYFSLGLASKKCYGALFSSFQFIPKRRFGDINSENGQEIIDDCTDKQTN